MPVDGHTPALAPGASVETTEVHGFFCSMVSYGPDTGGGEHPALLDHRINIIKNDHHKISRSSFHAAKTLAIDPG